MKNLSIARCYKISSPHAKRSPVVVAHSLLLHIVCPRPNASTQPNYANLFIALLENYSHARLIALCFAGWTGRPSAAERKVGTNAITSPAGSTTLPMPCEVRGHGKVWGTKAKPLAAYRRRLCCLRKRSQYKISKIK
jgi:hypothetical protein